MSFEPPLFAGRATLGGTLASNLSGPGRPWGGSVRDAVLGVGSFLSFIGLFLAAQRRSFKRRASRRRQKHRADTLG